MGKEESENRADLNILKNLKGPPLRFRVDFTTSLPLSASPSSSGKNFFNIYKNRIMTTMSLSSFNNYELKANHSYRLIM